MDLFSTCPIALPQPSGPESERNLKTPAATASQCFITSGDEPKNKLLRLSAKRIKAPLIIARKAKRDGGTRERENASEYKEEEEKERKKRPLETELSKGERNTSGTKEIAAVSTECGIL